MDTQIRKATLGDLERLQTMAMHTIDVSYRSFIDDEGVDWFLSGPSDDYLRRNIENATVLAVDGIVVGCAVCKADVIDLIMIDHDFHHRGLGTKLLAHCESALFAQFETITLESFAGNEKANRFYRKNGWTRKGVVSDAVSGATKWMLEKKRDS